MINNDQPTRNLGFNLVACLVLSLAVWAGFVYVLLETV
jgi:hypothetical protein